MKLPENSERRNFARSIADVVSVEGWTIKEDDGRAVHIDLSFRRTAVGGGMNDAVRFRLALLRAELVALDPTSEGIRILPQTVARDRTNYKVEKAIGASSGSEFKTGGSVGVSSDGKRMLSLDGMMGGEKYRSRNFDSKAIAETAGIEVNHRKDFEGNHRWELNPAASSHLVGSGWDAKEHPRFSIQSPKSEKIPRAIIFQVRCLREDLKITDVRIIPKDKKKPIFEPTDRAKVAAAEAFIKSRLSQIGLLSGDIANPFAEICIFETVVEVK